MSSENQGWRPALTPSCDTISWLSWAIVWTSELHHHSCSHIQKSDKEAAQIHYHHLQPIFPDHNYSIVSDRRQRQFQLCCYTVTVKHWVHKRTHPHQMDLNTKGGRKRWSYMIKRHSYIGSSKTCTLMHSLQLVSQNNSAVQMQRWLSATPRLIHKLSRPRLRATCARKPALWN